MPTQIVNNPTTGEIEIHWIPPDTMETVLPEAQAVEAVPPSPQAVPHPPVEDDYESWVWRRVTNSIARNMDDIPPEMRVIVCVQGHPGSTSSTPWWRYQSNPALPRGSRWSGYCSSRAEALSCLPCTWGDLRSDGIGSSAVIEFILPQPIEPLAEGKKSLLKWHFPNHFIDLMEAAPLNPMVRGHMMRILKRLPPDELRTFEQLKEWVEKEFGISDSGIYADPVKEVRGEVPVPTPAPVDPAARLLLEVQIRRLNSGRCSYTSRSRLIGEAEVTVEEAQRWVDNGLLREGILQALRDEGRDNAETVEEDRYQYEDHEESDSEVESEGLVLGSTGALQRIRLFLISQGRQDLVTQLGL